jgi:hypothetical protein
MKRKKQRKQPLTREQKNAQAEIDKEDGKWFRDLSKFILTALVLTSIFEGIKNKWVAYPVGVAAVVATYCIGTWYFNNYKKNKKNGNDNRVQPGNSDVDHQRNQSLPQGAERKRTRTGIDEATTSNGNKMTEEETCNTIPRQEITDQERDDEEEHTAML